MPFANIFDVDGLIKVTKPCANDASLCAIRNLGWTSSLQSRRVRVSQLAPAWAGTIMRFEGWEFKHRCMPVAPFERDHVALVRSEELHPHDWLHARDHPLLETAFDRMAAVRSRGRSAARAQGESAQDVAAMIS